MKLNNEIDIYDSDIDISPDILYSGINLLKEVNSSSSNLLNAFSNINLDGSDLASAYILSDVKSEIQGIISGDLSQLNTNINNVKNKLMECDPYAAMLFSDLNNDSEKEFGNFLNCDSSSELYDNLAETFGEENIIELDDGSGFRVIEKQPNGKNINYFFSNDCTEKDVSLFTYIPGVSNGKKGTTGDALIEKLQGGVPSGFVGVFSNDCNNKDILNKTDQVLQKNNVTVSKVLVSCFSGGGPSGPGVLAKYLTNHPEIKDASLVCVDANIPTITKKTMEDYTTLKDKNVSIYCISGKPDTYDYFTEPRGKAKVLEEFGCNVTKIYDHTKGGHSGYNKNFLLGDAWKCMLGLSDTLDKEFCDYEILNSSHKEEVSI